MQPAPRTYAVLTFGCRVNQADSIAIEQQLRDQGAVAAGAERAELVIVNTCSVTASADQGARQAIRRIVRTNPGARVVVTGCYATRRPDELRTLPNVVHVVSNDDKETLASTLTIASEHSAVRDGDGPCGRPVGPGLGGRTALTLRVQTGCEQVCSYCIIPRTRGASRSRALVPLLDEIRRAVNAGYREIILTGVHLGSYGRDLGDGTSLERLVARLARWEEDVLFRISSLEPMDCTAAIVELVAGSPRLAPHFHLPLQHGADAILRVMRRPYTVDYYVGLVRRIRTAMPHASIGSDVMVGFPGESDEHFAEMCAALEELPLTHLHVFPYSDRPGTAASARLPKTDGRLTRARGEDVRAIGARKARAFRASQAGTIRRALVVDSGLSAVTDNYLKVSLPRPLPRNSWVHAVID